MISSCASSRRSAGVRPEQVSSFAQMALRRSRWVWQGEGFMVNMVGQKKEVSNPILNSRKGAWLSYIFLA